MGFLIFTYVLLLLRNTKTDTDTLHAYILMEITST